MRVPDQELAGFRLLAEQQSTPDLMPCGLGRQRAFENHELFTLGQRKSSKLDKSSRPEARTIPVLA